MELSPVATAFATALLGALTGGVFSLYKTHATFKVDREKELRREEKEVHNLLIAMQAEISTLWQFHMRKVGQMLEDLPEGGVLLFYYPLTQDYFTVYHATAASLGKVRNEKLRKAIVVCYNKCKKVVDGFKFNNDLFTDYRDCVNRSDDSPKSKQRIETKYRELQEYSKVLKEDHFEVKGYVEELIALISHDHAALTHEHAKH